MSEFSAVDAAMMVRALKLAEKGRFTTSPNPRVGCVIAKDGQIIGEGYHEKAGEPHAEVFALRMAGDKAKGATAYVTLEPCSHHGRTPPCAEALIKAGVARVVAAIQDPFHKVAGTGLQLLRDAGIEVECGLLENEAHELNKGFIKVIQQGLPWVTAKMATSLDGKTALANGVSQWITGPDARSDVQRHRAESCAILTGSGTVLADDPSLNVRYSELGQAQDELAEDKVRQPLRVIIDSKNQLHNKLKIFQIPGDVLVVNLSHNTQIPEHVAQWQAPMYKGKVDLRETLKELAEEHINWVWVEAGANMLGAMMQEQLVDEVIYYIAPKLLGNPSQGSLEIPEIEEMDQAYELNWTDLRMVGNDIKITAGVRYPEVMEESS